jgi:hypothetical protein
MAKFRIVRNEFWKNPIVLEEMTPEDKLFYLYILMMSDIRESGSVEQDADVIMFLYRESYYEKEVQDQTLEIIVSKNRNGPVRTIRVNYNEHTGRIEDLKE